MHALAVNNTQAGSVSISVCTVAGQRVSLRDTPGREIAETPYNTCESNKGKTNL